MHTHEPIAALRPRIRTLTFDCYGTLIDWKAGLGESLRTLIGPSVEHRMDELFAVYVELEAEIEAGPYRSYREVLTEVAMRVGAYLHVPIARENASRMADLLPQWSPFADTNEALSALKKRFRLGVLSNIDRDLFAETAKQFSVAFDFVVTAEDVRSYKPAHGHFLRALATQVERGSTLHVAQSLFHDGRPAHELGIPFAWINRYAQCGDASLDPNAEYPDLRSLAAELTALP